MPIATRRRRVHGTHRRNIFMLVIPYTRYLYINNIEWAVIVYFVFKSSTYILCVFRTEDEQEKSGNKQKKKKKKKEETSSVFRSIWRIGTMKCFRSSTLAVLLTKRYSSTYLCALCSHPFICECVTYEWPRNVGKCSILSYILITCLSCRRLKSSNGDKWQHIQCNW